LHGDLSVVINTRRHEAQSHSLLALLLIGTMTFSAYALDIHGHRGARGHLPENTLPAFQRALELGVTTLELDCGITRDGVVVVSHDSTLNPDITRDADGRWIDSDSLAIWHLTYDELQRYDVGRIRPDTAYARRFPDQRPLDGIRIPKLEEVFSLVEQAGNTTVRFNIETKLSPLEPSATASPEVFVRALLQAIAKAGVGARVSIQSFDWRTLRLVQTEAPHIPTAYLTAQGTSPRTIPPDATASPWTAGFQLIGFGGSVARMVKAAGGAIWSPYYGDLTRDRVKEAQALGLKVIPWTVNAESDIARLIGWNVDGIISDYPDRVRLLVGSPG
jgi:glycerophosphoryl diester phosphodiesterase